MKRVYLLGFLALLMIVGCNPYKKTKDGLLYKIISNGSGKMLKQGNYYEASFDQVYKDSHIDTVFVSSAAKGLNEFGFVDSSSMYKEQYNIFTQMRVGDSLIIKYPTDSIIKRGNPLPGVFKRGEYVVLHYKLLNIFDTKEQAEAAYKAELVVAKAKDSVKEAMQLVKDDKIISDYLAKNNIKAVKAPLGTYVEIMDPGTGSLLDTSLVPKVKYTGKELLTGKVFDSNIDSTFGHTDLLPVDIKPEHHAVIRGWADGLGLLKKGAKARFYIPSSLAYGANGNPPKIQPNDNLVFDINVVDVSTNAQYVAEAKAQQEKRMAAQKRMMDSLNVIKQKKETPNK
jgi:FKBP-type peptidyl-prolyl cis-trans isomerase